MIVFMDTNIFYNNWHLKNANFIFLFHFINNTQSRLLLSNIVCEEVENINRREIVDIVENIKVQLKRSHKLLNEKVEFNLDLLHQQYRFEDILKEKTENVTFLSYNEISHQEVVRRALNGIRPFQNSEKGYRDTLLWLSFLKYLQDSHIRDEVAFITNNKDDFFVDAKPGLKLHPHLQSDIADRGITTDIQVYDSLYKFVEKVIDKDIHGFNHYEFYEKYNNFFDDFLEEESEIFLEVLPKNEIKYLLQDAGYNVAPLGFYSRINVTIYDGVEDPQLLNCKKVDNDTVFVSYKYFLRDVTIDLFAPIEDYYNNKNDIDSSYENIITEDDEVSFSCFVRVYLEVTFTHSIKEESQANFDVSNIKIKQI